VRHIVYPESLSYTVITILYVVLVSQSMTAVSLSGYAKATTTNVPIKTKLSTVVKMLVDNAIQEFQDNNINNTIIHLQGAEQELLSSLPVIVNNTNNINNNNNISSSMAQPFTILLLIRNTIQALDSGDYAKGQQYLNSAEQELGKNIVDISSSSSLDPKTTNNNGLFSKYTNSKYEIKLQYPYNWVIEADDYPTGAAGQAGILITSFYLPDISDGLPFFRIGTDDLTKEFSNLQKVSINQYLNRSLVHKNSTGFPGFNLIESDTNSRRLANNSAYTIVWTYTHSTYGTRKSIEIATILDGRGYFVDYTAATNTFSKFLPIVERMIESFQKAK
jgi:hypothetical protein